MQKCLLLVAALLLSIGVLAQEGGYADSTRNRCSRAGVTEVLALNPFLQQWIRYPSQTLDSMPGLPSPDRIDRYGGWADGPSFQRTGYFRTERHEGDQRTPLRPDGAIPVQALADRTHIWAGRPGICKSIPRQGSLLLLQVVGRPALQ